MKYSRFILSLAICLTISGFGHAYASSNDASGKPSSDKILSWLREGNSRFVQGKSTHPHMDSKRIILADTESQGKHALATILSCSDSRVPPEIVFDAGIMDLFVIRVAGNVANTDEIGTAEYGLCHVNTPVLVVLGHTQCGAVTAVAQEVSGHGHPLERNIPPLVASIIPAVKRTMAEHPEVKDDALVRSAVEANVWEAVSNLFLKSPAIRDLVKHGKVTVVGAVYDMHTGTVKWLPADSVPAILKAAEASSDKALNPMYEKETPPVAKPTENKATMPPAEQSQAAAVKELAARLDSKTAEAASELKEFKARIDSLATQVKGFADQGKILGDAGAETIKTLSADVKRIKTETDAKLALLEASNGWVPWWLISLTVFCALCLGWVIWRIGSLGTQQELFRGKVRQALDRVKNDIQNLKG